MVLSNAASPSISTTAMKRDEVADCRHDVTPPRVAEGANASTEKMATTASSSSERALRVIIVCQTGKKETEIEEQRLVGGGAVDANVTPTRARLCRTAWMPMTHRLAGRARRRTIGVVVLPQVEDLDDEVIDDRCCQVGMSGARKAIISSTSSDNSK
jgi:hypothetical protein